MIETIRRLLDFSDRCRTDLLCAFGYGVLYSVSEVIPVLAIVVALEAVLSPSGGGWFAVAASGGLMGLSVAGKIIFGKRATERRMLASYDMCADKRIEVGEILKRVPLGYFSQNRLGELTATLTTTLGEIETNAVAILDKVANGFVHAVAITLLISWYDWHAGLITAVHYCQEWRRRHDAEAAAGVGAGPFVCGEYCGDLPGPAGRGGDLPAGLQR